MPPLQERAWDGLQKKKNINRFELKFSIGKSSLAFILLYLNM